MTSTDALEQIVEHLQGQGTGSLVLVLDEAGDWSAAYTFGYEDPSVTYGYGATADGALDEIAQACTSPSSA